MPGCGGGLRIHLAFHRPRYRHSRPGPPPLQLLSAGGGLRPCRRPYWHPPRGDGPLPGPGGGGGGGGGWEAGAGCASACGHRSPPLLTARSRGGTAGCASIAVILRYETPAKHLVSFISRGACGIFSIYPPKSLFCFSNPFIFYIIANKYSKTYP